MASIAQNSNPDDPIISRAKVFETEWFQIIAKKVQGFPEDKPFYALESADYVNVLALTKEQQIVLVQQYRPILERTTLELPSGTVEKGEDPETCMRRELREETGFYAEEITLLGVTVPDVGRLANKIWSYFAYVQKDPHPLPPPKDELTVTPIVMDLEQFFQEEIKNGRFEPGQGLATLFQAVMQKRLPESVVKKIFF
ncbi:NUDIX hydrolase [Magnetococcales bacterium HHB-1]